MILVCLTWKAGAQNNLQFNFHNQIKGSDIQLGTTYTNVHGEPFSISLLNYYISNIRLTRSDGTIHVIPQDQSYFLVKEKEPESRTIALSIPAGKYESVTFMIGVDSLRSTQDSNHRTGVLDVGSQARGMYWQWNSGYIFFKMEGKSTAIPDSMKNTFRYHIGGYGGYDSKTINNIRYVTLKFGRPVKITQKSTQINIDLHLDGFFSSVTPIRMKEHPSVMWGPVSVQIANNYAQLFALELGRSKSRKK